MYQLPYTEVQDRHWSGDAQQWEEVLRHPDTLFLAQLGSKTLLQCTEGRCSSPAYLRRATLLPYLSNSPLVYLGKKGKRPQVGLSFQEGTAGQLPLSGTQQWVKARNSYADLRPSEASLMAYASGMLYWREQQRFCGRCGTATHARPGGQLLDCPSCKKVHYPRINPAVIMLIESENESGEAVCLLSQHYRTPDGMMTTLAGFVEVGETLEQAVKREVWEETQVEVREVRYVTSQPWPFPSSLMMGFFGKANYQQPTIDTRELRHARWYTAKELKQQIERQQLQPSRVDSIARFLILSWLASKE